jgi:predicted permease
MMSLLRSMLAGLRSMFREAKVSQELDEELRGFLEMAAEEKMKQGMSRKGALRAVRLERGSLEVTKEVVWSARWESVAETSWQDLRFAVRMLRKNPGFSSVAVLTLAIGIGANATIFAFVNTLLFRPPGGVASADQLVSVWNRLPNGNQTQFSYPEYTYFRDHNKVFSGLLAYSSDPVHVSWAQPGQTGVANAQLVSANYFSLLGVKPILGRGFLPSEDATAEAVPVVVLSYRFWHARLNSDPNVVGKTLTFNGHPFVVVGVASEELTGLQPGFAPEFWTPMMMQSVIIPGEDQLTNREGYWIFAVGRLKPGVSRSQAQGNMSVLARQLNLEYPGTRKDWDASVFSNTGVPPEFRLYALGFGALLMFIVGLVLLIACTNVANLLLSRGFVRSKEMAVRAALGASRGRLVRQLLIEAVLLAIAAGGVGITFIFWTGPLVLKLLPPIEMLSVVHIDLAADWRVICFTMFVALAAGVSFGFVPALRSSRVNVVSRLKEEPRSDYHGSRLRNFLVVTQVALSLALLASTGLCVRSLLNAQSINPGFNPNNRLMVSLNPGMEGYSETRGRAFYRELLDRIAVMPGVRSASLASWLPLGFTNLSAPVYIEGHQPASDFSSTPVPYTRVGSGYFAAMGIPLLRGREFGRADDNNAPGVAIVNEEFARRYWPGQDPMGKHITVDLKTHDSLEVVGVAPTGKYARLNESPQPFMYWPLLRSYSPEATLVVQTSGSSNASMLSAVKSEIQTVEPDVPIVQAETLDEYMSVPLFSARLSASLLGAFGLLALAMATAGLYSAIAYSVSQRTHEIGIRIALGARRKDILWQIVREGGRLALIGVAIGSAGSLILGRLLASLLYGVSPAEPFVLASVVALWMFVALTACYVPARRAMRVDPMVALRYE